MHGSGAVRMHGSGAVRVDMWLGLGLRGEQGVRVLIVVD